MVVTKIVKFQYTTSIYTNQDNSDDVYTAYIARRLSLPNENTSNFRMSHTKQFAYKSNIEFDIQSVLKQISDYYKVEIKGYDIIVSIEL